jgi:hypothetical protein
MVTLKWAAFAGVLIVIAGTSLVCGASVASSADSSVKSGVWGAQGVMLTVRVADAAIEYDCGRGTIAQKLVLDRNNKFDVPGRHFREGGPTRLDDDGEPARYQATVTSDTMTLTVTLSQSQETLGPFTLAFGRQVILKKCL